MGWQRMRFRDNEVFIRVGDDGKPVLDSDGRAEMRYRENDSRSYRPHPGNLKPSGGGPAPSASKSKPRRKSTKKPAAPKKPIPEGGRQIAIWTDGACTGNPGPMGIGIVILDGDKRIEHGEFLGEGTNNVAELVAIERGLEIAEQAYEGLPTDELIQVCIYSDSGYSIGVLSMGWKAKANKEAIARIRARVNRFDNLVFEKVPGHAGVPENERCDQLAREAITTRV